MADSAFITVLADQIAKDLNEGTFSFGSFQAERSFTPREDLGATDDLVVSVVPSASRQTPDNRSEWNYEYEIHVGVQKKIKGGCDNKKLDPLVLLCQEIADFYKTTGLSLTGENGIRLTTVEIPQLWLPQHIQQYSQFTSVVVLTFRTWK